jgi:hypothetical protein
MTSTPNSSLVTTENRNDGNGKTAQNLIGLRKSKRLSKRTPATLLVNLFRILYIYNI